MQQNENFPAAGIGEQSSAVTAQAKDLARTGAEQAKQISQTAKERAFREIDSRREVFASEIDKIAGTLEQQGVGSQAGPVIDYAASAARRLSNALRDNSAEQLLRTISRNPVAVLGGTFALGFIVTRLFKA